MLDRLETADRPAELHPREGMVNRHVQRPLQRARHLHGTHGGAEHLQRTGIEAGRRADLERAGAVQHHPVARLPG